MKNSTMAVASTLITALLFWLFFHFVVVGFLIEHSSSIGRTESYEKIDALIQGSGFTKSDLKIYLQADEYKNIAGKSKGMAVTLLVLTCLTVAIYSGIKSTLTKLFPRHRSELTANADAHS